MPRSGNEIVTLQFGDYSNHVGANFFNIQEAGFSYNPTFIPEVNNDILFMDCSYASGDAKYTPRLVLVDAKSHVRNLRLTGEIENLDNVQKIIGCTSLDVQKSGISIDFSDSSVKNNDEELSIASVDISSDQVSKKTDENKSWGDYLEVRYNERSFNIIPDATFMDVPLGPNSFFSGQSIWENDGFKENLIDSIHYQLEACDNLQGFHIILDGLGSFSGIAAGCFEYLNDEFTKKTKLAMPVYTKPNAITGYQPIHLKHLTKIMSSLSICSCNEFCDIVLPVSVFTSFNELNPPHRIFSTFSYKPEDSYNTSSILAAALELISLPYRTRNGILNLQDIFAQLVFRGRNIMATGLNAPFDVSKHCYLFDALKSDGGKFMSLTPYLQNNNSLMDAYLLSGKGLKEENLIREADLKSILENNPDLSFNSAQQILQYYFWLNSPMAKNIVYSTKNKFRIPKDFPTFRNNFEGKQSLGKFGEMSGLGDIQNTREMVLFLKNVNYTEDKLGKIGGLKFPGLSKSDVDNITDNLLNIISCYEDYYFL